MTPQREAAIYTRLEHLKVSLDTQVERGPAYLTEKLVECRQLQDETVSLLTEVRRARAAVKIDRRAQQAILSFQPTDIPTRAAVRECDDRYDALTALEACVNSVRRNLSQTDSDIRLHAKLVEHLIKLGPIKPSQSAMTDIPGTTPETIPVPDVASLDIGPFDGPPDPPAPSLPEPDLAAAFASDNTRPATPGAGVASLADIEKFLTGE